MSEIDFVKKHLIDLGDITASTTHCKVIAAARKRGLLPANARCPARNDKRKRIKLRALYTQAYNAITGETRPIPKEPRKRRKRTKPSNAFYQSDEWRSVRVKALLRDGRKCVLCGRTVRDGVKLHVDHIKPRSKYPELELELDNLQVLCEDCNLGKKNDYEEDWREYPTQHAPKEDARIIS